MAAGAKASPRLTVREAARRDERALLVALRDRLASEIDKGVPPHALAPLTRQLRDLARDIHVIDRLDHGDEIREAAATPDETWRP